MSTNTLPANAQSVILLSSGLDSTVNFHVALQKTKVKLALTFNYGQTAAVKEIERSAEMCALHNVKHVVLDLPWLKDLGQSALTKPKAVALPLGKSVSIDNLKVSEKTAKSVWIPNRNGIFLNIAAAYAESIQAHMVIPGFNAEEAVTFPDNSYDFIRETRRAFAFSTANKVDVQCFTINKTKNEIVKLGQSMEVPFQRMWVCYQAGDNWCGQCESCQRAVRAFRANHVDILGNFEKI